MHTDTIPLSTAVGTTINRAAAVGVITDAIVAAGDTVQGIKDGIRAVKVHADQERFKDEVIRALDMDAGITDASVLSLTTVAGLVALTAEGSGTDIGMLDS